MIYSNAPKYYKLNKACVFAYDLIDSYRFILPNIGNSNNNITLIHDYHKLVCLYKNDFVTNHVKNNNKLTILFDKKQIDYIL